MSFDKNGNLGKFYFLKTLNADKERSNRYYTLILLSYLLPYNKQFSCGYTFYGTHESTKSSY